MIDQFSPSGYFGHEEIGFTIVYVGMDPLGYEFVIEPDHFLKMDALDGYALMQALSSRYSAIVMEVYLQLLF